jgi:hypothetical protein
MLGLVAYATYDLTNQATLKDWPLAVTLADLPWGAFVTASRRLSRLSRAASRYRLIRSASASLLEKRRATKAVSMPALTTLSRARAAYCAAL